MIPVKINLHTSRDRTETYNYEVANDRFPDAAASEHDRLQHHHFVASAASATRPSASAARSTSRGRSRSSSSAASRPANAPHARRRLGRRARRRAAFERLRGRQLGAITLDIASTETKYAASLDRIALDRTEAARGETVEVQAYVRTESGKQFVQRIPVQIPRTCRSASSCSSSATAALCSRLGRAELRPEGLGPARRRDQQDEEERPALRQALPHHARRGHRHERDAEPAALVRRHAQQRPHLRRLHADRALARLRERAARPPSSSSPGSS